MEDGLNLNDNTIVEKLLKNLDINPKTFFEWKQYIQRNKDELKKRTNDNASTKVFLVLPSFISQIIKYFGGRIV